MREPSLLFLSDSSNCALSLWVYSLERTATNQEWDTNKSGLTTPTARRKIPDQSVGASPIVPIQVQGIYT